MKQTTSSSTNILLYFIHDGNSYIINATRRVSKLSTLHSMMPSLSCVNTRSVDLFNQGIHTNIVCLPQRSLQYA